MKKLSSSLLLIALLIPVKPVFADDSAIAVMLPTAGYDGKGIITFKKVKGGVHIEGDITGLSGGMHGIHIHQFGDCSSPDAESAGPHFNPSNHQHGSPQDKERHVGDLGNLKSEANQITRINYIDPLIALEGKNSILGRSVIIHEKGDDLKTQPSGDSGKRIACGVIGLKQ